MDRLNFRIPEFVRVAWVSPNAERVWAPIIQRCSHFFTQLESYNRTSIVTVRPEDMIGKNYIPLYQANRSDVYQSGSTPFNPNLPWDYRCAVGPGAENLARAHVDNDWAEIGHILGYPPCCVDFFMQYWVNEQWFDTTYPMGQGPLLSPQNNILLRWIGIRLVSHLPCSFQCEGTLKVGQDYIDTARSLGRPWEIDKILELLGFPVEWTSLHGIATITTPIFKIITATDALPSKAYVKLAGDIYPQESASGNRFPFQGPAIVSQIYPDVWTANGFKDLASMQQAHNIVLRAIRPFKPRSVIDLGCGNGYLLKQIREEFGADTYGIDIDPDKNPDCCMDLFDVRFGQDDYDVALIAEQRIEENPTGWMELRERIEKACKNLVIYDHSTGIVNIIEISL